MNKIHLLVMTSVVLAFTSCNKWLDIQPELEIQEKSIFQEEQGFQDVLIGAYIRMATPSLYGQNTTIVLPEMMGQHWTPEANKLQSYLSNFNFTQTDVKKVLETTWLQYYQTIVNINSLLNEIDAKKDLFTNGNYNLIKGEALGLRAFLHFEILRFWGNVPGKIVATDKAIPYVKTVTKDPNQLQAATYKEVLENILQDLNSAEQLLAEDPILTYSNAVLNAPSTLAGIDKSKPYPVDEFHFFRQSRFNYYAVKATKARYYLWTGNQSLALENALAVIQAKNGEGSGKFTLGDESAASSGQLTFPTEHIFAVDNTLATQTLTPLFFNNTTAYTQNVTYLNAAFESTVQTSDIRYKNSRLWENRVIPLVGNFNFFKKYNANDNSKAVGDMPLIRLAEMYFIAVECGQTDLFRSYRIARVLDSSLDGALTSPEAIKDRLEKEYRKEFYGEGQMFFFYKRYQYTKFTWPVAKDMVVSNYTLPIPQTQSMFE